MFMFGIYDNDFMQMRPLALCAVTFPVCYSHLTEFSSDKLNTLYLKPAGTGEGSYI